jgi:hypothetical protein
MNGMLYIKHRKLHSILSLFGVGVGLSIFFYLIQHIRVLSFKEYAIFSFVGFAFITFFLIFGLFVDSVAIDNINKTIYIERRIGPFRKRTKLNATDFKLVSIGTYEFREYIIGLMKDEQSKPMRLISLFYFFDTWKKAVEIAKYLNLPIYDTTWRENIVWKVDKIPEKISERRKILKLKESKRDYFL